MASVTRRQRGAPRGPVLRVAVEREDDGRHVQALVLELSGEAEVDRQFVASVTPEISRWFGEAAQQLAAQIADDGEPTVLRFQSGEAR